MDRTELRERVAILLREGNYIGAYGRIRELPDGDPDRVELAGSIANAIAIALDAARTASPDRQDFLRAQLALVCRDVPGLSSLYREQLRGRPLSPRSEIVQTVQDLAEGRPADAFDRIKRGIEDAQDSASSGDVADRVQGLMKDAERGIREGMKSLGDFFESARKRGEEMRRADESSRGKGPGEAPSSGAEKGPSAEGTQPDGGVKIKIDGE